MRHAPSAEVLAPSLTLGPVTLRVRDLPRMRRFYQEVIGLELLQENADGAALGDGGRTLLILQEAPGLPAPAEQDAGLYHLALLFSQESGLARALERVLAQAPHLFSGSADHLVSEAFYLTDPEGNGLELYRDRDPSLWEWEDGQVRMDAIYISPADYVRTHAGDTDIGTIRVGHVHLKVGDLDAAAEFYLSVVGFTRTAALPHALFMSIGGYHHHLGMNTWQSRGAGARSDTLGLRGFTLLLPASADVDALAGRLDAAGTAVTREENGIRFADPWNNGIAAGIG
jgi:catechol 2,3-dioxygenase